MTYTPPVSTAINFDFIHIQWCVIAFNFSDLYSPPVSTALHFYFTTVLFPIDFEFAPEVPEPISKALLKSLGVRLHGQVYKYWICWVWRGGQRIRRYVVPNYRKTPGQLSRRSKFASGVKSWQNLDYDGKIYWRDIGVRKKEPLPSFQTFLSAWMKDEVNLVTFRHIRNLSTR